MQRAQQCSDNPASEMAIVDTFTKLIFGEEDAYSDGELEIIEALRRVDMNVAVDNHQAMGEYLRALGVKEMIQLVSRVRERLAAVLCDTSGAGRDPAATASHLAGNRRAH
jgi:hypothetical protein